MDLERELIQTKFSKCFSKEAEEEADSQEEEMPDFLSIERLFLC